MPEFLVTPPDWDSFKEALCGDYPDTSKTYVSSEIPIWSLAQFATFNQEFRRITARLVVEGCSNLEQLKKAYTKSIHVTSECTALLSRRSGYGGVLDSGFCSCAAPTYYCRSKYF